ncbi:MAG: hypothetical protein E7287_00370 [Lachnospiraceae bacterium]|nr:hypothetical protein [Lachnospiraceae bacterium]
MLEHKLKRYIILSIAMACLQFGLIICIAFVSIEGTTIQKVAAYIVAFMFWTSIIFEILLAHWSDGERKQLDRYVLRCREIRRAPSGIFSFLKNTEAMVADILLFVSVAALGIILWMQIKTSWIIISVLSIFVLSFSLHCILNGKNYRYLKKLKEQNKGAKKNE